MLHAYAAPRERQRDPAGADAELERGTVAGQVGKEADNGIDDRGLEHVGGRLVVPLRHRLAEVVLGRGRTLSKPYASAYVRVNGEKSSALRRVPNDGGKYDVPGLTRQLGQTLPARGAQFVISSANRCR